MLKKCKQCNRNLTIDNFHKDKSKKDGLKTYCKDCASNKAKSMYEKNKDKIQAKHKEYWNNTKSERNRKQKEFRENNKDKVAKQKQEARLKKLDEYTQKRKEHYENNKEYYKEKSRIYMYNRRKNDLSFRILCNLRGRLYAAIKHNQATDHTKELLGCSLEELRAYLEDKFVEGMSWDNYGRIWHIDHIIPCAKFDLSQEEQQRACFHYSNLQPLFAIDNIKKRDKII